MKPLSDRVLGFLLFVGFFALYVHTCAPHIAPYRDSGEMISLMKTLGVAHPPGYPLYSIIGKAFLTLSCFGSVAYQANVFSALAAAVAVLIFFLILRNWLPVFPSLMSSIFLGLMNPFWELASVSEMYTLGILWVCLLFYSALVLESAGLWAFLMAIGLGVRMDLMLLIPVFLYWFWTREKLQSPFSIAACFLMGLSIYLYLPIRSLQDPVVDWGNPDSLTATFNSATRKSYGGTLDLLSLSYKTGENFIVNFKLYLTHLGTFAGWWYLPFMIFGFVYLWKNNKQLGSFLLIGTLIVGPFFLFLANMPPNPHSLAIVEASYLLPDFFLIFTLAFGLMPILTQRGKTIIAAVIVCSLGWNVVHGFERATRRDNFFLQDYVSNALRSAAPGVVLVMQKDVQLFAMWHAQLVERTRLDIGLIAKGLSGSDWYWDMRKRWKTADVPDVSLKTDAGWSRLKENLKDRKLMIGYETDYSNDTSLSIRPNGLLMELLPKGTTANLEDGGYLLTKLMTYRGHYRYGTTPDFFSTDLIGDHARAHHQQGYYYMTLGRTDEAIWFFRRAEAIDPTFPRAPADLAYLLFLKGNFNEAYWTYQRAVQKFQGMLASANQFKSLPHVVADIKRDLAFYYIHMGVCQERMGHVDKSRELYQKSMDSFPTAQAHYNMAVTYWDKNWDLVISHLAKALDINPGMREASDYLVKAQMAKNATLR